MTGTASLAFLGTVAAALGLLWLGLEVWLRRADVAHREFVAQLEEADRARANMRRVFGEES